MTAGCYIFAGGGTGGHVVPALAVAAELRARGHMACFIGTRRGMEARLVPQAGFAIDWIEIGGLNRVGALRAARSLALLPASIWSCWRLLGRRRAAAVFSMGGYVAAPVVLAAIARRIPVVAMEPNALPGLVTRRLARFIAHALVSFEATLRYFPAGRAELCGLPVRQAFFDIAARPAEAPFTVLVTGGSQGSRALNQAARAAWPVLARELPAARWIHQSGLRQRDELAAEFALTGLAGEVTAFIEDMPAAYAAADVIVSRSGAGAVAEICAAGRAAVLVPLPSAADDHQRHNALALVQAGAAELLEERSLTGPRLAEAVIALARDGVRRAAMARAARALARAGAARRAADVLEEMGRGR